MSSYSEGSSKAARAISNYFGGPSEKKKPKKDEEKSGDDAEWYDVSAQIAERKKKLNAGK